MAILRGNARLDTGEPATFVLVRDWDSYAHIASSTPDADGAWSAVVPDGRRFEVTVRGPARYRPMCDGPISPET